METGKFALWLFEILAFCLILSTTQWPLRNTDRKVLPAIIFILKLPLFLFVTLMIVAIESVVSYRCIYLLAACYVALLGDILTDIVLFFSRQLIPKNSPIKKNVLLTLILSLVLTSVFSLGFSFYGTGNAVKIEKKTHNIKAASLTKTHTFAFLSDLHFGSAQSETVLRKLCASINAANPEFVILGGDITDELSSYEDMVKTYRILSSLKAPTYYIYGNHDRQPASRFVGGRTYTDEQLVEEIKKAGITILQDQYTKLSDEIVLLGREDLSEESRIPYANLMNPYEGEGVLIVADHNPYDNEQLSIEDSLLQLSGHTHAGQLWPLEGFYRLIGLPAYGNFSKPHTLLYVSAGASVWGLPLRTERRCEWELITLMP